MALVASFILFIVSLIAKLAVNAFSESADWLLPAVPWVNIAFVFIFIFFCAMVLVQIWKEFKG